MTFEIGALGAITAAVFSGIALGLVSHLAGTVILGVAPVILGLGRAASGKFGRILRVLLVVLVLPILALFDVLELTGISWWEAGAPLLGLVGVIILLAILYALLGGRSLTSLGKFGSIVPVFVVIIGLGAASGLSAGTVVFFLLAVAALRLFSQSRVGSRVGGPNLDRSSSAAFDLGAAGVALSVMAFFTASPAAGNGLNLFVRGLAAVALQTCLYLVFAKRRGTSAREAH